MAPHGKLVYEDSLSIVILLFLNIFSTNESYFHAVASDNSGCDFYIICS